MGRWTYHFMDVEDDYVWAVYVMILVAHFVFFFVAYGLWCLKQRFLRKFAPGFEVSFEEVKSPERHRSLRAYGSEDLGDGTAIKRFLSFDSQHSVESASESIRSPSEISDFF